MITIFTKNRCAACRQTKKYFTAHNIPFVEKNIEESEQYKAEMYAMYPEALAAPVVVVREYLGDIGYDDQWTGFDLEKMEKLNDISR